MFAHLAPSRNVAALLVAALAAACGGDDDAPPSTELRCGAGVTGTVSATAA
ncbi:MAG: hypothetical protein R2939_19260 [Kofleriaceae bacterium]